MKITAQTPMRFGEFLCSRGILSAAEVLEALAEQARQRTFLPLLLAQEEVISAEFALHHSSSNLANSEQLLAESFREGCLSARDYLRLEAVWRTSSPPLGQILIQRGLLSREELEEQLRQFHYVKSSGVKSSEVTSSGVESATQPA